MSMDSVSKQIQSYFVLKLLTNQFKRDIISVAKEILICFNTLSILKGVVSMNKIFGYCRVSTRSQNIERQERNIKAEYPDAKIVKEAYTGTKIEGRREFEKILANVETGDTIVFDSVSRMSRNAEDGTKLYFELFNKGINLVFLKEPYINTEMFTSALHESIGHTGNDIADIYIDATNKVLRILAEKQIIKAFEQAEKEVQDLRQRVKEGQLTAVLNGKSIGISEGTKLTTKKSIEVKEQIKKYCKDFDGTNNDTETMRLIQIKDKFGNVQEGKHISRNSYYKYKAELFAELSK